MKSNPEDNLLAIGEIVPDWEHFEDRGQLRVVEHSVIYTVSVEIYQCLVCGRKFDVANDYDVIGPRDDDA